MMLLTSLSPRSGSTGAYSSRTLRASERVAEAGDREGGRHPQMRRGDVTVIIPNPHDGDIGVGLLRRLLRQADETREEWLTG